MLLGAQQLILLDANPLILQYGSDRDFESWQEHALSHKLEATLISN
jgi:hypothetical protein